MSACSASMNPEFKSQSCPSKKITNTKKKDVRNIPNVKFETNITSH
jgi:hypothetical protein